MSRPQMMADLRQSLAEAGLPLADTAATQPRGGVHLRVVEDSAPAVRVTWAVHHRLYADLRRGREALDVLDVMNLALAAVLTSLGWDVIASAPGQPAVVIGRRIDAPPLTTEAGHD